MRSSATFDATLDDRKDPGPQVLDERGWKEAEGDRIGAPPDRPQVVPRPEKRVELARQHPGPVPARGGWGAFRDRNQVQPPTVPIWRADVAGAGPD
jgi:hypothetical protein